MEFEEKPNRRPISNKIFLKEAKRCILNVSDIEVLHVLAIDQFIEKHVGFCGYNSRLIYCAHPGQINLSLLQYSKIYNHLYITKFARLQNVSQ